MNAEETLFGAYREWYRLAKAAHKAIGKHDWGFLLECQAVIRRIQPSITNLHREVSEEWKRSNADCAAKKKELNAMILKLKELLESNKQLLRASKQTALSEREKLDQVGLNLKRLQSSYVLRRASAWTSFS
jgi:hypothetical protein